MEGHAVDGLGAGHPPEEQAEHGEGHGDGPDGGPEAVGVVDEDHVGDGTDDGADAGQAEARNHEDFEEGQE